MSNLRQMIDNGNISIYAGGIKAGGPGSGRHKGDSAGKVSKKIAGLPRIKMMHELNPNEVKVHNTLTRKFGFTHNMGSLGENKHYIRQSGSTMHHMTVAPDGSWRHYSEKGDGDYGDTKQRGSGESRSDLKDHLSSVFWK